jgi:hypothetical protein
MDLNIKIPLNINAKVLKLYLNVCDDCQFTIETDKGEEIYDNEKIGYVPDFFPGDHYGDFIIFDIDIDTGQIINWEKPTSEELEKLINNSV